MVNIWYSILVFQDAHVSLLAFLQQSNRAILLEIFNYGVIGIYLWFLYLYKWFHKGYNLYKSCHHVARRRNWLFFNSANYFYPRRPVGFSGIFQRWLWASYLVTLKWSAVYRMQYWDCCSFEIWTKLIEQKFLPIEEHGC